MPPFSRFSRYFVVVAREGSLRRAAEFLHVSASAIDRHILLAEEEYGVPLFDRLPQGLKLTAAGELLLANILRWQNDHRRLLESFADLQGLRRGHVSIGVIEAVSENWVPPILATLIEDHPRFTYDLRVLDNDQIVSELLATEIDIGILLDPQRFTQLHICGTRQIQMGVVVPARHVLSSRKSIEPSDLAGFRQILPSSPLRIANAALSVLERSGSRLEDTLRSNDIRMTQGMVRAGLGVAVLSEIDIASPPADGRLAFIPLAGIKPKPLSLGIAIMPHRQLSRSAQLVLDTLVGHLAMWIGSGQGKGI